MSTDQTTRRSGRHRSGGRVSVPPAIAPGAGGPRLAGLDVARGLAVLSMLVAHLSPVGGVLDLSEYLTAPLFALLVGAAMGLALARPGTDPVRFVADNALRGLLLVALGVLLQALYGQVDVVLPYLGVLVVVLAPLAVGLRRLPVLTLGVAAGAAVLGPLVTERARDALAASGSSTGTSARHVLDWLAAGPSYRLVSFLPMALGGLALALLLPRLAAWRPAAGVGAVLLAAAGVVHALGAASSGGAAAYSGTTAEVVAGTFLAGGVVAVSFAVADLAAVGRWGVRALDPVLALGRLALTAYTVQVLVLALVSLVRDGARDDSWVVLLVTTAAVVGSVWLLDRTWGTGPLELLVRLARLPSGWQPGAALAEAVSAARQRREPPAPPGSTPPEE
ncbi:DUF418 domain-containing protein [Phycicoccus sonneratiae]|uniref:DUF418 domain-containing protein n=1 Tax=Phycicoccus sonneratiae TaxID=2807628 RepID=A0ABS2CPS1_9MICO|nr:DUF418 domain-containing protein [Phycicoccus sonneraticus]MBM6401126.1 DUF418 domain-containing protein [Phycicoccus sonneraticus]